MKQILVIGGDSTLQHDLDDIAKNEHIVKDSLKAVGIDATIRMCPIDQVVFWFDGEGYRLTDGQTDTPLETYDLVIFKGVIRRSFVAQVITRYLKLHEVPYLNGYEQYRSVNKLIQLADMAELAVPIPASVFCENKELLAKTALTKLTFPMITKVLNSSGGRGIFKVNNEAELGQVLTDYHDQVAVVTRYIPNDGDFRVLLIGDKTLVIHRQAVAGHYINNISQGGKATLRSPDELPPKVLTLASKLQAQQALDIAGVDVIKESNTNNYYFLEVNSQPNLGGVFEEAKTEAFGDLLKKYLG